jgi:SAM-dependent methyltransferase
MQPDHASSNLRTDPTAQTVLDVDYDHLWKLTWGDMQKYGPASRHSRRVLARMLDGIAFRSVLDVGCGEGSNLAFLHQRYRCQRLTGCDVSESAIERARRAFPVANYFVGPPACLTDSRLYDLVMSIDVLEHVPDDVGLLRQMAEVTRRYVLCVTVQGRMRPQEVRIGHVRNYKRNELQSKMTHVGLAPIRAVEWGFPFYSPVFRSFVSGTRSDALAYGRYTIGKRLLCHAMYLLFLGNSWRRGDRLFVLAERQ